MGTAALLAVFPHATSTSSLSLLARRTLMLSLSHVIANHVFHLCLTSIAPGKGDYVLGALSAIHGSKYVFPTPTILDSLETDLCLPGFQPLDAFTAKQMLVATHCPHASPSALRIFNSKRLRIRPDTAFTSRLHNLRDISRECLSGGYLGQIRHCLFISVHQGYTAQHY